MRTVPGVQLSIENIYGRDDFISEIWRILEAGSVRMEAERRIGKSHILRKMVAQPREGWECILIDLEQVHSAGEFAEVVCKEVESRLAGWKRNSRRAAQSFRPCRGCQDGGPH